MSTGIRIYLSATFAIGLLILMTWSGSAVAEGPCDNVEHPALLKSCEAEQHEKLEAELTRVYREYKASLPEDGVKLLVRSQRAWIGFREANCALVSGDEGKGSIGRLAGVLCLNSMDSDRIRELRFFMACTSNDVDCPYPKD